MQPFGACDDRQYTEHDMTATLHLKSLAPDQVRAALERRASLLVPVGTCEQHGPHLPMGCDTIIVEHLVDDLSAALGILRAPTIEYGVNTTTRRQFPGNAAVRRKTLHRWMNELLANWELGGIQEFVLLTAHGDDPHQEALTTIRTHGARVFTVDILALDFTGHLEEANIASHGGELDTSLLLYLAPHLVRMDLAQDYVPPPRMAARLRRRFTGLLPAPSPGSVGRPSLATAAKGKRLYELIRDRIATDVLGMGAA